MGAVFLFIPVTYYNQVELSFASQPDLRSSTTAEGGLECWKPGTRPEGVGLSTAERVQRMMERWNNAFCGSDGMVYWENQVYKVS